MLVLWGLNTNRTTIVTKQSFASVVPADKWQVRAWPVSGCDETHYIVTIKWPLNNDVSFERAIVSSCEERANSEIWTWTIDQHTIGQCGRAKQTEEFHPVSQ